jgi:DNA invertase Pin-like site-specific DNA recombinase
MILTLPSLSYVAYYRVSTKEQGESGLGLAAQKQTVRNFVKDATLLIGEFTEVESGKSNYREQLQQAMQLSRSKGATLVIAKLDRLSRNASFIFMLRDSGVNFICADMPEANTLTIGIFAVLAQHERELISTRTKAALAAKKGQGYKLGSPANLTQEAIAKGREKRSQNALSNQANKQAAHLITMLRETGVSFGEIVKRLNELGYRTRRGGGYSKSTVKMLFDRYKLISN